MAATKLVIQSYKDPTFSQKAGPAYTAQLNPAKITHGHRVKYNTDQGVGTAGASSKLSKMPPETLGMELIFDSTGVIAGSSGDVWKDITAFKGVVYTYNGSIHSPNYLVLSWGSIIFKCKLTDLSVTYELFRPDGTPVRAKATVSFIGYIDDQSLALKENRQSADLTHLIIFKEGDNLPNLCYKIYGNANYYYEVAKANSIIHYRNITAGTEIYFPPLISK